MGKLLVAMFAALLTARGEKLGGDSSESNQSSAETVEVAKIDLDNPES